MSQPIRDAHAREHALNVRESFIVQAPAGSGKTETLTQRFLALLPTVHHPEEIIAITFTRKAASEMRERLCHALQSARDPEPDEAHLKRRWHLAKAALAHSDACEWRLLENPARLRIQTLDSLAASLVAQMPIESKFGITSDVVEDATSLYKQAARNLLQESLTHHALKADANRFLGHLDNHLARAETMLAGMLAKREQWLPKLFLGHNRYQLRELCEQALKHISDDLYHACDTHFSHALRKDLFPCLEYAFTQSRQDDALGALRRAHCPHEGILCGPHHHELWQSILALLFTGSGKIRKSITKNQGFPAATAFDTKEDKALAKDRKQAFTQLLEEISGHPRLVTHLSALQNCPARHYSDSQWAMIDAMLTLLPRLVGHCHLLFSERAVTDFTEINLRALQALGEPDNPTDLLLRLDYQISHLLIDEFQDTSQAQFALIERLTQTWDLNDQKTLFLVGDPMQSIYRFRQAEVGLFLRVAEHGLGHIACTPLLLTSNFRSNSACVNWFNEIFIDLFPQENNPARAEVRYSQANPLVTDEANAGIRLHACTPEGSPCQDKIVTLIQDTLLQKPDASIAILVRARSQLREILPALRHAGLRYRATALETLADSILIQSLQSLTLALHQPYDRIAWLALCRTPWVGLSLADLTHIASDKTHTPLQSRFKESHKYPLTPDGQARIQWLTSILTTLQAESGREPFAQLVEKVWIALGGEALLENAQDQEAVRCYFECLSKVCDGKAFEARELQLALTRLMVPVDPSPSIQIDIMTIHKSKGLEFDCVFIPALEQASRPDEQKLMLFAERTRESSNDIVLAPMRHASDATDAIYRFIADEETAKLRQETLRLFYVAVTRAKWQCHLFASLSPKDGGQFVPPKNSLCEKLWDYFAPKFSELTLPEQESHELQEERETVAPVTLWRQPKAQIAALMAEQFSLAAPTVYQNNFSLTSDTFATTLGTLTHAWLYQLTQLDDEMMEQALHDSDALMVQQVAQSGLLADEQAQCLAYLQKALSQTVSSPRGRWLLSNRYEFSVAEYALHIAEANGSTKLILDRAFTDDGACWIVDYKTPVSLDEEAIEMQKAQYREQLIRYQNALAQLVNEPIRLALYFPLQDKFAEL